MSASGLHEAKFVSKRESAAGPAGVVQEGDASLAVPVVRVDFLGSSVAKLLGGEADASMAGVSQSYLTAEADMPSSTRRGSPLQPASARP